jgi:BirA family biotin operon repressor/biotin-[acetyl-CoA-carboxylase] ligase
MFPSLIHPYSIIELETIDSTNNYVASLKKRSKIQNKTVILASFQSKGKGQYNNIWQSEKDQNLLLSIYLQEKSLKIEDQIDISRISSLAIKDTISHFLPGIVQIKWPNDIFINNKKIAGILIENSLSSLYIDDSTIGIGINVNQQSFGNLAATSFKNEITKEWKRPRILEYLLYRFEHYIALRISNRHQLHQQFDLHLYKRKEWILIKGKEGFIGRITGTDAAGQLLIENKSNQIRSFQHREISFI